MDDEPGCSRWEHRRFALRFRSELLQPDDFDFASERLELRGAGDEFGFALLCQCGGEGVGEAEFVAGFEVGGHVGERACDGMKLDGQRGEDLFGVRPRGDAVLANEGSGSI